MMSNPEKQIIYWSQHQNNPSKSSGLNKFQVGWLKKFKFEKREKGLYVVCEDDVDTEGNKIETVEAGFKDFLLIFRIPATK